MAIFLLSNSAGFMAAKLRAITVAAPVLLAETGPARIEGRLIEIDSNDRNKRLRLQVQAIEGLPNAQTPRFVRFSYRYPIDVLPGRAISCTAILSPPPKPSIPGDYAFHRDAWFQQLGAVGFAVSPCEPVFTEAPSSLFERLNYRIAAIRRVVADHVLSVAGPRGGALAAAMIAGDRSNIAADDVEALRASGLAHLLAISGLHMALAGGAFFMGIRLLWPLAGPLALRVPAIKIAALGAIIGCTAYYLLSGGSIATQRAYIMALIAFSAKLIDKPALSLRSLSIAFGVIVLLHPEAVVTPGFQMSFAASGALIGTFEYWSTGRAPRNASLPARSASWFAGAVATSLTASLATMPFALHHFDRAAPFGIAANLAITPIISFWAAPSAAAALLASTLGLQDPFLASLGLSLESVAMIAHTTTQHAPDIVLPPVNGAILLLFASGIAAYTLLTGHGRVLCIAPLALGLAVWSRAERPVGYIASNRAIYLQMGGDWFEVPTWEAYDTLPPLSLNGRPTLLGCEAGETGCEFEMGEGQVAIEYDTLAARLRDESGHPRLASPCTMTPGVLKLRRSTTENWFAVRPCDLPGGSAAILFATNYTYRFRWAELPSGRPWSSETPPAQ